MGLVSRYREHRANVHERRIAAHQEKLKRYKPTANTNESVYHDCTNIFKEPDLKDLYSELDSLKHHLTSFALRKKGAQNGSQVKEIELIEPHSYCEKLTDFRYAVTDFPVYDWKYEGEVEDTSPQFSEYVPGDTNNFPKLRSRQSLLEISNIHYQNASAKSNFLFPADSLL